MKLILDCPYICHKVRHGMKEVDLTSDTINVEVIFGFLKQLLMICKRFQNIDGHIFCWDSRKSLRKKMYPEYKANRRDKIRTLEQEEFDRKTIAQFNEIRRYVLPGMGFSNNFIQTGLESDDIMASVVINNPQHSYLLVSSDRDMFQLLDYDLKMYSLHTRKIMDKGRFVKIYGISPDKWVMAKAIGGCSTDNVHGIAGASDPAKSNRSLAIAYIQGTLNKGKVYNRIESEEGKEIIKRNIELIKLPFHATKKFEIIRETLWRKDFHRTFSEYNFQSLLRNNEFRVWEHIMDLY